MARLRRVPPAIACSSSSESSSSTPSIAGTAAASTSAASPLAATSSCKVAEQPEAGDVGHRVGAGRAGRRGGVAVERRHHLDRLAERRARRPRLTAVETAPAPSGLVSTSASPGCPPALVMHLVGVHDPRDRHPELRLDVLDRVAAEDRHPGLRRDRRAPAQDLQQYVFAQVGSSENATRFSALTGVAPIA